MYPQVRAIPACRLVEREYVLIFEEAGRDVSLVLNHAGSRAFSLMDGTRAAADIAATLAAEGGGAPETVGRAVNALIEALRRRGIAAVAAQPWPTPCPVRLQPVEPVKNLGLAPEAGGTEPPAIAELEPLEVVAGTCDAVWDGGGNCMTDGCLMPYNAG